ncbi:hypothetical protein SELMODRAFT_427468 [Selaginella moellendorffii]|uniref:Glucose-methanol-choline oxidoreductase N-terminal domain-containing protein n=1 Tax=Selaginella moellendorffii TaxID=88036 RepID=D8SZQ5_SELML|nr:hypothetical protein SELMODRAFT_427468 [Selaginella moellendorffii]
MLKFHLFFIAVIYCTLRIIEANDDGAVSFIREANSTTLEHKYDYIVVGGGTAGCAIAATLSQRYKVLVLERGGSPYGNPLLLRIENSGNTFANPGGLEAPNQAFTSEDGVASIRPNVLGGGSSINGAVYNRAPDEFISDAKLDKNLVESSYAWVEKVVASRPRNFSAFQNSIRGALLEVGVTPDFGFTYKYVVGTKTTGNTFDSHGQRHPSSDLLLAYANHKNIDVLLHATVYKVLLQGGGSRGVLYTDNLGRSHTALLSSERSEVIISAGALGTLVFGNQSLPSGGTVSSPDRRNATLVASGSVNRTISEFCRRSVSTNYHYHGGCPLGEVVDWSFRVMGLNGLRVVDGSTFLSTPGTNPQATVMMLGRYVGVEILKTR